MVMTMDINNKTEQCRIDKGLYDYIKKIEKKEECKFTHASKILRKILDEAGGLKDY